MREDVGLENSVALPAWKRAAHGGFAGLERLDLMLNDSMYGILFRDINPVRELRNHTARVIAAIESGEPVTLTVHGRPVADIVPRVSRSERRPSEQLLTDLAEISDLAAQLNVGSSAEDFDVGLTTDDMLR